jgi:L-ribulose-5-phosphate 3-epimerase
MMSNFKIGVMVDSFHVCFDEGLIKAREAGAQGIQVYATEGEMAPENLTKAMTAEKKKKIAANGLEISALCGDLGGHGFARQEDNGWKIEKSKRIVDLALELNCNIITTHIGVIPADNQCKRYAVLQNACHELGEYAHKCGAVFAIETGPEKSTTLAGFISDTCPNGLSVNFDPANFVMVTGEEPSQAVRNLSGHIVHTHAKDGIMIKATDPQIIYDFFAEGGIGDLRLEDYFKEVPLGQGDVCFDKYLGALAEIGYKGYLTIEREVGKNPEEDIRLAVQYLKAKINQ